MPDSPFQGFGDVRLRTVPSSAASAFGCAIDPQTLLSNATLLPSRSKLRARARQVQF